MKFVTGSDGPHLAPSEAATVSVIGLPDAPELERELDAMVADIKDLDLDLPDEVIRVCTAYMARCTELHMTLIRAEGRSRQLRWVRTQQLTKVMDLIEFTYKASSRIIELRRQDVELSR